MSHMITIVTPAFNEALNLPILHEQLTDVMSTLSMQWEWIVIDDCSQDGTWSFLQQLANTEPRLRAIRFANNHGSHAALSCGLHHAQGDCAVVMAADLQDPPDTIPILLGKWHQGAQIVWAVRRQRKGESWLKKMFSRFYYQILRRYVGIANTSSMGADYFLIDRKVINYLQAFKETHVSITALITWMGFKQEKITYIKQARQYGQSGWSMEKKLKHVVDAVTAFTYKPIRFMSYVGIIVALAGFIYALVVIFYRLVYSTQVPGYPSLIVAILVVGGLQMIMLGVLGEYVWRALDEARNRPRFIIEDEIGTLSDRG